MILHFMTLELKNNSKITLYIFYLKSNIGCIVTDSPNTSTPYATINNPTEKHVFCLLIQNNARAHVFCT